MTQEEKAKAYDNALERAKEMRTTLSDKAISEYIFPELKESKDERIRKIIRGWIYTRPVSFFDNGISKEEMLAWLEKQGKEEYALKSFKDEDVRKFMEYIEKEAKAYEFNLPNRGYDIYAFAKDILYWFEKQCEKTQSKTVLEAINEEKVDNTNKVEPKFKLEHGKWYRCILTPVVHKHFTVGKVYKCELEGCLVDDINEDRIVDLDLECFRPATEDEIPQDPILIRLDRIYDLLLEIRNNNMLRQPYIETYPPYPYPIQPWYDTSKPYCNSTNKIDDERPEESL